MLLPGASSPLSVVSQYADDTSLVVTTTDAIKAVFDTYAVFASSSGSRLNQVKSKGLWLGSWHGRVDAPVRLDWTSRTLKVLGVFIGSGNVDELNWRPRIVAVKNVLNSWRQRGLSFRGKALIVNALALARIWYVADLIHLPAWALGELSSLVFSFFWKGKPDLVARKVVSQPTSFGGFGVVSIQLKVWALLVQWIRRLVTKPASWVHFFYYYCWHLFGYSPSDVLSRPLSFDLSLLPPFYDSLLVAWQKVDGGFSNRSDPLVMCASGGLFQGDVSLVSTKLVYSYLLSAAQETPHCVTKFFPRFGPLYWSCIWRQLFFFDVDRQVIDLAWKVSHGILYTASRLVSFG